jgi:hypothetical protein
LFCFCFIFGAAHVAVRSDLRLQHNNKVRDEGTIALGQGLSFNSSLQVLELVSHSVSLFLRPMQR